jgi:signal transduction histidine kinase
MDVTTTIQGNRRALPSAVDRCAYRILQEALTNAARHGGGRAEIEIAVGPRALELTVVNPLRRGRGAQADAGGHGLIGMRERAAMLGGSLGIRARDGCFEVHAQLPLVETAE